MTERDDVIVDVDLTIADEPVVQRVFSRWYRGAARVSAEEVQSRATAIARAAVLQPSPRSFGNRLADLVPSSRWVVALPAAASIVGLLTLPLASRAPSTPGGAVASAPMLSDDSARLLATLAEGRPYVLPTQVVTATRAVSRVRFAVRTPTSTRAVAVVGDFNGWDTSATPLSRRAADGTWSAEVPLDAGRHVYAFVVDGVRWVIDPLAPTVADDGYGPANALVIAGFDK